MNNNIINKLIVFIVCSLAASPYVFAEGSFQTGLNQPLRDYDASNERLFVDILSSGEVINVHLCGDKDSDDVSIKIYDPSNNLVLDTSRTESTIACNDALNAPLSNAIKYTTLTTGAYALELNNNGSSGDTLNLRRFDVTVTPDLVTDPDPGVAGGRLWSNLWSFDTGSFSEVAGTDADYYPLVPGGRTNTHYVWKLDLNKFSGNVYEIIANDLGVDAPRSGYSTLVAGNTAAPKFPIYLTYPIVAKPRPTDPPVINSFRFIDDAGQDYAISPSVTSGVQDSGNFEFTSDINGTYSIIIDTNNDGAYDADDVQLLGNAVAGSNQVAWDGRDASGNTISTGTYSAKLSLRMGEYHFIGRDVETSGGPSADGLTIYLADSNASAVDTNVYWDDKTLLGGTSTLPTGAVSSSMAGKHTWGNFSSSSIGNVSFIDTYVYGLSSTATALVAISTSDVPLAGVDGTLAVSPLRSNPGDTLTATVADADLNLNPGVAESIIIRVLNNRSSEVEQISLTETGSNTGIFSGTASTAENATAGINNDGSINSIVNDVLTFTYQDQLDSVGGSTARMVLHSVGIADTSTSTISALPDSIIADGITTSAVTIQLKDASGNNLTTGGDTVILSTTAGTLGAVTDNNNGTYNATLTSSTTIEMATISGTLNGGGNVIVDTATVTFTASVASTATSTLMASPGSIVANGLSTTTVTVQLKDASGNNLTTGGDTVVLSTTAGTLGAVTDNNNGTYSSTLTSSAVIVTATISGTLNGGGNTIVDTATVAFTAGAASTTTSTLTASPASITANGSSTSTITVQAKDANGDNLGTGGDTVVLSTTAGTLGAVTDNNNGTYTAILTSSTSVETATISGTMNGAGNTIVDTATVTFAGTTASTATSTLTASPVSIAADGISTSAITVQARDANGNNLSTGGDTVVLSTTAGTLGTVTDSNNGTYTATLTSSTTVATATISGTLNGGGNTIADTATVAFTAGAASTTTSTLTASPASITANGSSTSTITIQAKDASGNNLTSGGDAVVLSTTAGTLGTVTDNNNGTYTATLTSSTSVETATISGTLNGAGNTIANTASVAFVALDDADGDGIPDADEGTGDTDGDGIPDFQDPDSDNDGIPDTIEKNIDSDNDGVADYKDLDSDNDGVTDAVEGATDTDSDGIADYLDLDTDSDGIPDIKEAGGTDSDGNGLVDNLTDANSDGLDDAIAASPLPDTDSDNDGIPDRKELDSDNDGIYDLVEAGGTDNNSDGLVDGLTDNDNDGFDDTIVITPLPVNDTDLDGVPDYRDLDSDNDGLPDVSEGAVDTDLDGVPDYHDLDSDNDGIPDITEAGGVDIDGDARIDNPVDSNGDGIDDATAATPLADSDSDVDNIPDRRELDSDNDGVNDLREAGGVDVNNDGIVDGFTDINGDGYDDMTAVSPLSPPDTDNDGLPDYQDNDDLDNDGVPDTVDLDDDNDGIPDAIEGMNDSDNDGIADSLELDSDNDGIRDLTEAGGIDSNNDGKVDNPVDNNADGLDDILAVTPLPDTDSDSDGLPDRREEDSDNDGIPDSTEGVNDTDGDGIPDYRDLDSDNDGIPDADEGLVDTDNDGVPDYRDLDSDNDGVQDILEAGDVDGDSDGKIDNLTDANGDGLDDGVTSAPLADKDTDSDGKPDRQDLDSDNDKVSDIVEAGGTDNNSDGVVDGFVDADGDGRDDSITATPLVPPDSNSNGVPDFQENEKGIETGLKGVGGGCSISTQPTVDPMLPLLLLISVMVMTARIKNRTRK